MTDDLIQAETDTDRVQKRGDIWFYRKGWDASNAPGRHEIPFDKRLPHIQQMLDAPQMRDAIIATLWPREKGSTAQISECHVASVSYRPGRAFRVSYAIELTDDEDGNVRWQTVYAQTMSEKRNVSTLPERLESAVNQYVSFVCLEGSQIVLAAFPYDLRVCGLHLLFEAGRSTTGWRLQPHRKPMTVGRYEVSPSTTVISYRPERHCLFRCTLREKETKAQEKIPAFARVYRDDRGVHVFAIMQRLWRHAEKRCGALNVAQPLGYDKDRRILFQSFIEGRPLVELAQQDRFTEHIAHAGTALAEIHAIDGLSLDFAIASRRVDQELNWLAKSARKLERALPDLGRDLHEIVGLLQRAISPEIRRCSCLIHGDFSLNQILVEGSRVAVIDFDDSAYGNPHADIGTFLARLHSTIENAEARQRASGIFIDSFRSANHTNFDDSQANWFCSLGLARLGMSKMSHLQCGWQNRVKEYFYRAIVSLSGGNSHPM